MKSSWIGLIISLIFFTPFMFSGLFLIVFLIITLFPLKPLTPDYSPTDEHIIDEAEVIDDEESLEEVLQAFEDLTGISPCVMTVYDSEWIEKYDYDLEEFAYSTYLNTFSDEQHFLIVYSEPENAEELDFVDWSWEAIQGDETDPILTESKFSTFQNDLHDDFLREDVSVGEAFEHAFENSLTYMMEKDSGDVLPAIFMAVVWNLIVFSVVISLIKGFVTSRRDYQEVTNGTPNYGNNGIYQNNTSYQSNDSYQGNVPYQNSTTFQGDPVPQYNNNVGTQYNGGMQYNSGTQYNNAAAQYGGTQYGNAGTQYGNVGSQYNAGMTNNDTPQYNSNSSQYGASGTANSDYFNDDARFRGPEYYDDDARYRGSTAYEAGKK